MTAQYFYQDRTTTRTKVYAFTSGKGGVGKTSLLVNTALELAREGKKVLILDGDLGMANVDIMFGRRPARNISHVFSGEHTLEEVICRLENGIDLIPGGSGLYKLSNLSTDHKRTLLDQVSDLGQRYDYMLIDTAPGIEEHVLYLNSAAQNICVVLTPDPSSLADSYALIKVLHQTHRERHFKIICNQVRDKKEGDLLFMKFNSIVEKFLGLQLEHFGTVSFDAQLRNAVHQQRFVVRHSPDSLSSVSIREIVKNFDNHDENAKQKGGLLFFWNQMLSMA